MITAGVDGLFMLGSSGQVAYLNDDARAQVVQQAVASAAGQVPVIVGTPSSSAARVIDTADRLIGLGAAAIVVTAPVYALNDLTEIESHFRLIAKAVPVPVFAYDVPVRVRTKLPVDMLLRLGQDGVITGVKDSSGDDVAFRRLVAANRAAGSPISVFTGHEIMCDGMFLLGADGAVPGLANVDPAGYVRMWQAAQRRDWEAVLAEQERLRELFEIVFVPQGRSGDAGGIGAFKAAAALLGLIDSDTMPQPLTGLLDADKESIEQLLAKAGLLR